MAKILIISGGRSQDGGSSFPGRKKIIRYIFLRKMKSLEKNCLLPEKDAAILPIPVTMKRSLSP